MFITNHSLLSPTTFIIICSLVFLAGLLDAIAGGGALISIPAYLIAGIPVHMAIATNKLSASFGATTSAVCFMKNKLINLATTVTALFVFLINGQVLVPLGIAAGICNMIGSRIGASLVMTKGSKITKPALLLVLALLSVKITGLY